MKIKKNDLLKSNDVNGMMPKSLLLALYYFLDYKYLPEVFDFIVEKVQMSRQPMPSSMLYLATKKCDRLLENMVDLHPDDMDNEDDEIEVIN
ncbi:MAG: hypothetical protein KKA84_16240 [Bacteroidetes bacterium]|nr:hypothetical protein [Bacteroidota bacterium]